MIGCRSSPAPTGAASFRSATPCCVEAAAWWLSEPDGGKEFAYALLAASCAAEITTEHVYLTLITPYGEPDDND